VARKRRRKIGPVVRERERKKRKKKERKENKLFSSVGKK
jgi:hypothetical protein